MRDLLLRHLPRSLQRNFWQRRSVGWRFLRSVLLGVAIAVLLTVPVRAIDPDILEQLPPLLTHPVPENLQASSEGETDYFAEIKPSILGYLIWSEFPVKVYFSPLDPDVSLAEQQRQARWQRAVEQAIAEWGAYLPLVRVETVEMADIVIERRSPPVQKQIDPVTGKMQYSFARNAETTYRFFVDSEQVLRHRMNILLSPHQSQNATMSTARHEFGHALGLWGHSLDANDALFFSQTRQSNTITKADVNTLQKIYQQPTRLGWKMP